MVSHFLFSDPFSTQQIGFFFLSLSLRLEEASSAGTNDPVQNKRQGDGAEACHRGVPVISSPAPARGRTRGRGGRVVAGCLGPARPPAGLGANVQQARHSYLGLGARTRPGAGPAGDRAAFHARPPRSPLSLARGVPSISLLGIKPSPSRPAVPTCGPRPRTLRPAPARPETRPGGASARLPPAVRLPPRP